MKRNKLLVFFKTIYKNFFHKATYFLKYLHLYSKLACINIGLKDQVRRNVRKGTVPVFQFPFCLTFPHKNSMTLR